MKDPEIADATAVSRADPRIRPEWATATDTAPPRVALLSNGRYGIVSSGAPCCCRVKTAYLTGIGVRGRGSA